MATTMDRRSFMELGIAAAASAGVAGLSATAFADEAEEEEAAESEEEESEEEAEETVYSFEIAPDPIDESEITEEYEADVIVVGAGTSGLVTAKSSLDQGLSVIVFSQSDAPVSRGGSNHAIYSTKMEELGLPRTDAEPFLRSQIAQYGYKVDQRKWYKWYNNSEESMNWLIDIMDQTDAVLSIEMGNGSAIDSNDPLWAPVAAHGWNDDDNPTIGMGQPVLVNALADMIDADDNGQVMYQITAKQLIRGGEQCGQSGRVDGVVGERAEGGYVKFTGTKAIVLATGDFSTDYEMMEKYCPDAIDLITNWDNPSAGDSGFVAGGLYDGQGQKMGLWVGAAWQHIWPNGIMAASTDSAMTNMPYNIHSGLLVGSDGKRFANELMGAASFGQMYQNIPGGCAYAIADSNYPEARQPWYISNMAYGDDPLTSEEVLERWDGYVESGSMYRADTLEELIEEMGLPETTLDTIETYNEYCANGEDEEFHKTADYLVPIETAPFYGIILSGNPQFLTVLGGLRTDENMRVCDEDDNPIEGLYNVGTMVGDTFSGCYNFLLEGHNYGMNCVTFGYLTGKYIAENE